MAIKVKFS